VLNTINILLLSFLNLVHYKKLLLIASTQFLLRFALCIPLGADLMLSNFYFSCLVLSTVCIAASGFIMNGSSVISNNNSNNSEKPLLNEILKKRTYYMFLILNLLGVGIGFIISNHIHKPDFFGFFIVFSAFLYLYASFINKIPIISTILISIVATFPLLIIAFIDLIPAINPTNLSHQTFIFSIILNYSFILFFIFLIRDLVNDIVLIDSDKKRKKNSLPIWIGIKRTSHVAFCLSILVLFAVVYYNYNFFYMHTAAVFYSLCFVLAPLLLFSVKIWDSSHKNNFRFPLKLIDFVIFFGSCSLLLFPLSTI